MIGDLRFERDRRTGTYRARTDTHTYAVDHVDGWWELTIRGRPGTQTYHRTTSRDAMLTANRHATGH